MMTVTTVSKARVAGKACHVIGASLAIFLGVDAIGALDDLLSLGADRAAPGLTFVAYFLACVLTLVVALVALLLLTMLEGVAFAAVRREPQSPEQRRREWHLALLWAAVPACALLGLAAVNAWWGW
ncbi:MAG: hypothetical protein KGN76_10060 [Acidobacteriota bacterium]|nr:hypothetical protein [Acidobacteriota bacterium]